MEKSSKDAFSKSKLMRNVLFGSKVIVKVQPYPKGRITSSHVKKQVKKTWASLIDREKE